MVQIDLSGFYPDDNNPSGDQTIALSGHQNGAGRIMRTAAISLVAMAAMGINAASADDQILNDEVFTPAIETVAVSSDGQASQMLMAAAVGTEKKSSNKWLIGGAMALILAALTKLIGANRVLNMAAQAGPTLRKAGEAIASAPAAAANAIGSAVTQPFKFLILVGGLALVGFTGISIFDLHWSAGLATGAGLTALTWVGSSKLMKKLRPIKLRRKDLGSNPGRSGPSRDGYAARNDYS